jgi:hypothetical protein
MDPDANLEELRRLIQEQEYISRSEEIGDLYDRAERMAELIQALDEWMVKGGFPPTAWMKMAHQLNRDLMQKNLKLAQENELLKLRFANEQIKLKEK